MHRWGMPIAPLTVDLSAYEHVTICTPVWAFSLASPIREFCKQAAGRIRETDYILVHYTKGEYKNVVEEMDSLLGIQHTVSTSISCKMGTFRNCVADKR